jgi:CubicO group peptidase (beta-lactamase class C family)
MLGHTHMTPQDALRMADAGADGSVSPGFEPLRAAFEELLSRRPGFGASICVYVGGEAKVDIWGGGPYRADSVQVIFSATKGAIAVCAALLVQRGLLDLDAPVASVWPEFAQAEKDHVSVRWLLSHRVGLPTVERPLELRDLTNSRLLVSALEEQAPYWKPGTAHGYHAWTMGTLVGEVVQRITGRSLGQFFASEVAEPLGLDFWIGLPETLEERVVPVRFTAESGTEMPVATAQAVADTTSLTYRVMSNPILDLRAFNERAFHEAEIPAANGIASSRSLARMYSSCIGPVDGLRLLDSAVLSEFCVEQSVGLDVVACEENRFGLGFMLSFARIPFAGPASFGHDGAGGALAFADPELGISFAFLSDRFPAQGGADPDVQALIATALECLA